MLILDRKPGTRVFIGDDIVITVLGKGIKPVRLGITAPNAMPIHREEVLLQIMNNTESKDDDPDAEVSH